MWESCYSMNMNGKCLLSIIIPMYNAGKYIDRCLSSCYHQDINEIQYEVIVIDDGSIDDSREKVMNWKIQHENLQYIYQENQGQSIARNYGMAFARGEYIWFIDADDEIEQDCLSDLLSRLYDDNLDMLNFNELLMSEEGSTVVQTKFDMPYNTVLTGEEYYKKGFKARTMHSSVVNREFISNNHLIFRSRRVAEDTEFCYQLMAYADRVEFINKAPYIYYVNIESVTQKNKNDPKVIIGKLQDALAVSDSLKQLALELKLKKPVLAVYIEKRVEQIIFGILYSVWKQRREFEKAKVLQPFIETLKEKGVLPFHIHFSQLKKYIFTHLFINRVLR